MTMNSNGPNGLVPYKMLGGKPYSGATSYYQIAPTPYATSIFTGDPVTMSAGYVTIGAAGSAIIGVFAGCKYIQADGTPKFSPYWPASTAILSGSSIQALVIDDPDVVYSVQEDNGSGAAGTHLAQATGPGFNYNFAINTGNTTTGLSAASLNNGATNTTYNLKILELDPTINNAIGNFANWLVIVNNDVYRGGSTGTANLS